MAQVKGLGSSEGRPAPKPYAPGEYTVECENWVEEDRGDSMLITITMSILEGPEQDDEGSTPEGKTFTHYLFIPYESHPSYSEAFNERSVGELKEIVDAFQVPLSGDSYDPEDAIQRTAKIKLALKSPSKKEKEQGFDGKKNVVRKWMVDEEAETAEASYAE